MIPISSRINMKRKNGFLLSWFPTCRSLSTDKYNWQFGFSCYAKKRKRANQDNPPEPRGGLGDKADRCLSLSILFRDRATHGFFLTQTLKAQFGLKDPRVIELLKEQEEKFMKLRNQAENCVLVSQMLRKAKLQLDVFSKHLQGLEKGPEEVEVLTPEERYLLEDTIYFWKTIVLRRSGGPKTLEEENRWLLDDLRSYVQYWERRYEEGLCPVPEDNGE